MDISLPLWGLLLTIISTMILAGSLVIGIIGLKSRKSHLKIKKIVIIIIRNKEKKIYKKDDGSLEGYITPVILKNNGNIICNKIKIEMNKNIKGIFLDNKELENEISNGDEYFLFGDLLPNKKKKVYINTEKQLTKYDLYIIDEEKQPGIISVRPNLKWIDRLLLFGIISFLFGFIYSSEKNYKDEVKNYSNLLKEINSTMDETIEIQNKHNKELEDLLKFYKDYNTLIKSITEFYDEIEEDNIISDDEKNKALNILRKIIGKEYID